VPFIVVGNVPSVLLFQKARRWIAWPALTCCTSISIMVTSSVSGVLGVQWLHLFIDIVVVPLMKCFVEKNRSCVEKSYTIILTESNNIIIQFSFNNNRSVIQIPNFCEEQIYFRFQLFLFRSQLYFWIFYFIIDNRKLLL